MKFTLTLILAFIGILTFAQTPSYEHVAFTYDAAGNRTKREYFVPPPPEPNRDNDEGINSDQASQDEATVESDVSTAKKTLASSVNGVRIYPNPTKSSIEIDLGDNYNNTVSQSFDILDLNGKIVQRFEIISQTSTLQMSGYRSGMYYVHFKNDGILKESWKVVKIN
jgi:hypothetical protein